MQDEESRQLFQKYHNGSCTEYEQALIEQWLMDLNEGPIDIPLRRIKVIGSEIYKNLPAPESKSKIIRLWSVTTAVASVSLIGMSIFLFHPKSKTASFQSKLAKDIAPGDDRAIIEVNGKTINLSDTQKGIIVKDGTARYSDGTVVAQVSDDISEKEAYQTISTPRGGQYRIELPDKTKVWLNAATVLHFSASLRGRAERKVILESGEAYFEIAKDKDHPFIVSTGNQQIVVLGTHFNVNAYAPSDEIKTTLMEGSVKIAATKGPANFSKKIVPGQQAIFSRRGISIRAADSELETAWKRGKTEFENADLKTVMNMLERWYDIETVYKTENTESKFTGSVSRCKNISAVLKLLESTGEVHFKIEGRKVLIMK